MHNLTKVKLFRALLWITYPISLLLVYPFVLLKKRKDTRIFFLLDRYELGGAQRVHIDILSSLANQYKKVYFTRRSRNDTFKKSFYSLPDTDCSDIHVWCDNLIFRLFSVHYFAFLINRTTPSIVFGSNSTFFYDMLPFLRKEHRKIELLHNFTYGNNGMEFFGLFNHQYLNTRVVVDAFTLSNIKKQYAQYNVDPDYAKNLLLIEPGIDLPITYPKKDFDLPLKVLYAGRGGEQKRVWLIDQIAQYFIQNQLPVIFHFAGGGFDEIGTFAQSHSVHHGTVDSKEKMNELYGNSHVILLTSAYEGFPMVIKEGMAMGCIPVVTALEGNKTHLVDNVNALLIDAIQNEQDVVTQGISKIQELTKDTSLLQRLSKAAFEYAHENFDKKLAANKYVNLFK